MYKISRFLVFLSTLFLAFSCADDSEIYKIGSVFSDSDSKIGYVDTLTVNTFTISLDSFVTSGYNKVFFGYNNDPYLGKTIAESYVTLGYSSSLPTIEKRSSFDSLVLVVKQNGNYLGDTMTAKQFSIYRLTEDVELAENSSYFYNVDSFARESTALATFRFIPRPKRNKIEYIHFPDSLGQLWFDWIVNSEDSLIETSAGFLDYFKGLAFVPDTKDENWSTSFYGLNSSESSSTTDFNQVELRLYYTEPDAEENTYFSFKPVNNNYIFSHFTTDRNGTITSVIESSDSKIASSQTGNNVFMQAGSGIGIKVEIPQAEWMYQIGSNISVLDAKLIMRPTKGTYDLASTLPGSLGVYWTDKKNRNNGNLTDANDSKIYITGTKYADDEFDENTYYSFSILSYVLAKMATDEVTDDELMFLLSSETMATSFEKLILDDQSLSNNSFELQIHYYKSDQ